MAQPKSKGNMPVIAECMDRYKRLVKKARSENTATAYGYGLQKFSETLLNNDIDPKTSPIEKLTEEHLALFLDDLKELSVKSESLYLTAVSGFYKFLGSENLKQFNFPNLETIVKFRKRKPGIRIIQFPENEMNEVLELIDGITEQTFDNERDRLIAYRDRAFLLTLADTGLRVSEICNLVVGSVDLNKRRAVIVGKGNKQALVRFSRRSINAIRDYLRERSHLDNDSGRQKSSLPMFSRHDKGAGVKRVKAMSTATARMYIAGKRIKSLLQQKPEIKITPHSFRHYFVTRVVRKKGLSVAQKLARHNNIQTTQHYTHLNDDEIDKGYKEIFDELGE